MNRRQAIGLGAAAAVAIPAGLWWWKRSDLDEASDLAENKVLAKAVDVIIPETDTPGAKTLGVNLFVAKMVNDCYPKETQANFLKALEALKTEAKQKFNKKFEDLKPAEAIETLKGKEQDESISLLKKLTIRGYSTSEYFMMNIKHFEFIPGRYIGCVNLSENA